jgi:hypothetical protein
MDFMYFYNWALETGFEYGDTLSRTNKSLPYSPQNCVWIKSTYRKSGYSIEDRKLMKEWDTAVNRIRKAYGMELLEGTEGYDAAEECVSGEAGAD